MVYPVFKREGFREGESMEDARLQARRCLELVKSSYSRLWAFHNMVEACVWRLVALRGRCWWAADALNWVDQRIIILDRHIHSCGKQD